jgi:tagatose-6-phosphate ketose/aldose isomerase
LFDDLGEWLLELGSAVPAIKKLLRKSESHQRDAGYFHTLREISQQPITWNETAARVVRHKARLLEMLHGSAGSSSAVKAVVLTGSGSSCYAGECLAPALQEELQLPVSCVSGGAFLTQGSSAAPPSHPCLVISLARSGDSPESCGAIDCMLQADTEDRHLIVTCNEMGKLANHYRNMPRIFSLILHERTNDQSLVMTSSFTNMVLAARFLGMLDSADQYMKLVSSLGQAGRQVLLQYTQPLADIANQRIPLAVFLGSGGAYGAAREAALKMLEMSGGQAKTFAETFLGLRHGPMTLLHAGTLVVCFLASGNPARAYELDLIRELDRKELGVRKIIVGQDIPDEILQSGDLAVEVRGLQELGDFNAPLINILVGQLLAFFHCMFLGLQPDAPSARGIISRVVGPFPVYQQYKGHFSKTPPMHGK